MGVDTAGSHFLCPYLRRLHELLVDLQRRNSLLSADSIDAVYNVLFQGIHIGIIGGGCGFWLRNGVDDFSLCRFFTSIRLPTLHLHTFGIAVPIDLEAHRLADVPEPHIVAAADGIGGHVGFLSIHKNAVGGKRRF